MAAHKECLGRVDVCGRNSGQCSRISIYGFTKTPHSYKTSLYFTESVGTIKKVKTHYSSFYLNVFLIVNILMLFATQRSSGFTNPGKKYLLKSTF